MNQSLMFHLRNEPRIQDAEGTIEEDGHQTCHPDMFQRFGEIFIAENFFKVSAKGESDGINLDLVRWRGRRNHFYCSFQA